MMFGPSKDYFRYFAVSQHDREWDIYVPGTGYVVNEKPVPVYMTHPKPYRFRYEEGRILPEYQLIYITRGEGVFESEATRGKEIITPGTMFLLFPGVWHRYAPSSEDGWDEHWVSVNGAYFDRLVKRGLISAKTPILKTGLEETIFHGFRRIWERVQCEPPGLQQLIAANVIEILGAALAAVQSNRGGRTHDGLIHQACQLLQERCDEIVAMDELAASLHVSYNRFRHLFKQQTGLSPYQYHLQLRINRAQEMLRGTPFSIKEIAAALNFDDPYHFSKIFKEKTGMSPAKWRGSIGRRRAR
jgi:AraC-like DNA-binding protein